MLTLYSRAMSQLAFKKKKAFGEKSILDTQLKEYELMFNKARKPLIPFAREESPNINVLLALAKSYLLESKFGYADAVLKQCVTQEVNNYKVFYLLSFLHFTRLPEIGFKNAFEVLERAYVLNPYDEKTVLRYADFMFNLRAPSSDLLYHAIAMVKEYQKLNPRSINVYMKLGYFYLYLNEIENAEKTYNMADSLFPGDKNIILNRGIIAQRKKEFSKAIDIFNSIIDENEYKDVYTYLGGVYLEKEEPEKALEYFRKRVRISRNEDDPMYREALKGIRNALQVQEDMNEK
ncbi:MAG: hypothetical protein KAR38_00345 [Calditrichia bacterium]|nr:hypothetical protein [Calditrichia bacterium]